MNVEQIYKKLLFSGNAEISNLTTRCLLADAKKQLVVIDQHRMAQELRLYKFLVEKDFQSIISSLVPIILANLTIEQSFEQATALFLLIRRKITAQNKIGITLLCHYLYNLEEFEQNFAVFKMIDGTKEEEIALQKLKIDIIMKKNTTLGCIVECLEEQVQDKNIELLQSLAVEENVTVDEKSGQMATYLARLSRFEVAPKIFEGEFKVNKLSKKVGEKSKDDLIGAYEVLAWDEELCHLKLESKRGILVLNLMPKEQVKPAETNSPEKTNSAEKIESTKKNESAPVTYANPSLQNTSSMQVRENRFAYSTANGVDKKSIQSSEKISAESTLKPSENLSSNNAQKEIMQNAPTNFSQNKQNIFERFAIPSLDTKWQALIEEEYNQEYFSSLLHKVDALYTQRNIFPKQQQVFRALQAVPFDDVKVVIIGQDPYHGAGQANGMCFSVNQGVKAPPSLVNIFKELQQEFGKNRQSVDLSDWASQGVLLLNAVLTVEEGAAGSHAKQGWEIFTDKIIFELSKRQTPLVFILWGNYAAEKAKNVDASRHLILRSNHPSPLSAHRGFFGNNHFLLANDFLRKNNMPEVVWV